MTDSNIEDTGRPIKFRFWSLSLNSMSPTVTMDGLLTSRVLRLLGDGTEKLVPMQFTGLLDKHGVEIFEGDIVKDRDWISSVKPDISPKGYCFYFTWPDDWKWVGNADFEVIGNIYENSELLS